MAKKIRKSRISLTRLFIELMIPWIMMGIVAAVLTLALQVPDFVSIIVALGVALVATFFIRNYEMKRGALNRR